MNRAVPSVDLAIGIDIGGSKTAVGIVDRDSGAVLGRKVLVTPPRPETGPSFLAELAACAAELRKAHGAAALDRLGVGVCELVDRSGEIVSAHRVVVSRSEMLQAFDIFGQVSVDSDVRAAAVAEARFGRGRGLGHWIYVNAGTGISSVLMNGDECHVGKHGWVYSLGMTPADLTAGHASSALIEDLSGGLGLLSAAREAGLTVDSVRALMEAASAGSGIATGILTRGGRVLGGAIALLANTLDPEAIILGGGIAAVESPYWEALAVAVRANIWHLPAKDVAIHRAALSVDAGMIGAALAPGFPAQQA